MNKDAIAIIGVSFKLPGMENWNDAVKVFEKGKVEITDLSDERKEDMFAVFGEFQIKPGGYLDRVDLFDNKYFGITKKEAIRMSPEERFMLLHAVRAFYDAGYSQDHLKSTNTGVFYVSRRSHYHDFFDGSSSITEDTPGISGTRIANYLDLRGPILSIDTTCSSSTTALHYACNSLKLKECDVALVGGVNLGVSEKTVADKAAVTSKSGVCRPFDFRADGTLGGEGVICLVAKRLEDAQRDNDPIYATIEGGGINHGGARISTLVAPSSEAQTDVLLKAWSNAMVSAEDIRFIEAHGTGTILGDPIEYKGIIDAFKKSNSEQYKCAISAVKGQVGHLDTMSGLAGVIRMIVALNSGILPPQASFAQMNDHILQDPNVQVQKQLEKWDFKEGKRIGGLSSFGLTGTNVHLVFAKEEKSNIESNNHSTHFIQLSESSEERLNSLKLYLSNYLTKNANTELAKFASVINRLYTNREFKEAYTADSTVDLIKKLDAPVQKKEEKNFILLNLSTYVFSKKEIQEIFEENLALKELGLRLLPQKNPILEIDNDALRSVLFQFVLCRYAKQIVGNEILFISRKDENTVQKLLLGELQVEDIITKPEMAYSSSENFNTDAFIAHVSDQIVKHGKSYAAIVFDNEFGLGELLTERKISVVDGQFSHGDRIKLYKEFVDCGLNGFIAANQSERLPDLNFPNYQMERFWPEFNSVKPEITLIDEAIEEELDLESQKKLSLEEIEYKVAEIWKNFLEMEELPLASDDFFEIGGSSLSGLDILMEIEKEMGIVLSYQDLFDYAVFDKMTQLILDKSKAVEEKSNEPIVAVELDLEKRETAYQALLASIDSDQIPEKRVFEKVLVTGATGFLGAFLVNQLIKDTDANILCLVRGTSNDDAKKRFESSIKQYFEDIDLERVVVIIGEITTQGLGIQEEHLDLLKNVQAVYHSAGHVAHFGKYEKSHLINVEGTINVFDWANENGVEVFNQFSTLAVSEGNVPGVPLGNFYESDLDIGQQISGLIYAKSKFIAEEYVRSTQSKMDVNVFRMGNIGGRFIDGLFQKNIESNNIYLMLRTLVKMGIYSKSLNNFTIEFEPVDYVVNAISKLSVRKNSQLSTFHLFDNKLYPIPEIIDSLRRNGISMVEVSDEELMNYFEKASNEGTLGADLTTVGIIRYAAQPATGTDQITHFNIIEKGTLNYLEKIGISMEYDRTQYLDSIIKHGIECGFLSQKITQELNQ